MDPNAPPEPSLRDTFARQRTHLANERTLFAAWRTALAALGLGFLLLRFESSRPLRALGWAGVAFAVALSAFGIVHYHRYKRRIEKRRH